MKLAQSWLVTFCLVGFAASLTACSDAHSRKAAYISRGEKYFNENNYDKARVEYRNAAQIDPKDANVSYLLGQVAEKTGDLRGAIGAYRGAIENDPGMTAARAALARIYLYGGLKDKAAEQIEEGLKTDARSAALLTVRAALRSRNGDIAGAVADGEMALQISPGNDDAIAVLASLYRQQSQTDRAVALVQGAITREPDNVEMRTILADLEASEDHPDQAEQQLREIIRLEPKVLQHRYRLASFYLSQNNAEAAEKTLREAVGASPADRTPKLELLKFLAAERGRERAEAEAKQMLASAGDNDEVRNDLGQFLVQLGKPEEAAAEFRTVIAHAGTKPQGLVARDRLAVLSLSQKDVAGASKLVAEVLQQNPRDTDALVLDSQVATIRGDATRAITDLRTVVRDQPNSVPVIQLLAKAYQLNGEPAQAEEALRGALQGAPHDLDLRLMLAQTLLGEGKGAESESLLRELGKDQQDNEAVQEALFRAVAAQKRFPDALAIARDVQQSHPKSGLGFYLAGLIDEATEHPDAAAREYDQAVQRQPNLQQALAAWVRLQVRNKHPEAALARLEAIVTHAPENVGARELKADVLVSEHQLDAGLAEYEAVIGQAPTWLQPYRDLAMAQLAAGHDDAAIEALQRGIGKVPDADVLVSDLGNLFQRLGRFDDAIAFYERVLAQNPHSVLATNNLVMLLINHRTDAASLARAQKLADQLAAFPEANLIDTRGWVKFKSGDFHSAESLLQQAVDKAPSAPEMRYHLGMAQLRSGESEAARRNLESAVNSNASFFGIEEARAALSELKKVPMG